jgi:hypothetical protein
MPQPGISELIREGSLSVLSSDIPEGVTLAEYAAARPRRQGWIKAHFPSVRFARRPK